MVLSLVKMGPFHIKRHVGWLAYKLDLPPSLDIHPVISVIHLEQAHTNNHPCMVIPEPLAPIPPQVMHILDKQFLTISESDVWKIWKFKVTDSMGNTEWCPSPVISEAYPELVQWFEESRKPCDDYLNNNQPSFQQRLDSHDTMVK